MLEASQSFRISSEKVHAYNYIFLADFDEGKCKTSVEIICRDQVGWGLCKYRTERSVEEAGGLVI